VKIPVNREKVIKRNEESPWESRDSITNIYRLGVQEREDIEKNYQVHVRK
jgi:hypothetical protein